MSCNVTYTPLGETEPIEFTEAQFVAFLAAGEYDKLVEAGVLDLPKIDEKTDIKEDIRQRNKEADKKGRSVSQWLQDFREKAVSPKELTDLLDEMNISKTTLTNKETIKQAQEILNEYQQEFEDGESTVDPINRVIDEAKKGQLPSAAGQVLMQIVFKNTAFEIKKALEEGDRQKANFFFELQAKAVEAYSEQGTDAGRALQVRKMFMDYVMNDPELANYYYMKQIQKSNADAKKDATNKQSANEIKDKVNKAKEKAVKEVAAEVAASIDDEISKEITKGIGKNATEEKKQQVRDYFAKLKDKFKDSEGNTPKTYSSIVPITPAAMVKMISAVEELVIAGIDLQAAISKVSTDLIRKGTDPKEVAAMKSNLLGAKKELSTPREKTTTQLEREAASKELKEAKKEYREKQKQLAKEQKEADDLQKRIEKQAEKIAKLKTKEEQAQKDRIDATELQRIQLAAKEAEKELENIRKQEIEEKRDLSKRIVQWEEKVAALKAKEQEAIDNANIKANLDEAIRIKQEYEANQKQLQKDIDRLTTEVLSAAKKSDQNVIEALIETFYSKPEQLQSDLEEMVVTALGVTPKEAVKIAEKIKNGIETQLQKALIKDIGRLIPKDDKPLTEEQARQKAKKESYLLPLIGKYLGISKKQEDTLKKMLRLSMMNVLTTDDIMQLMAKKYGISEFTFDMAEFVKAQARKVNEADTQGRRNKEMAKMVDKMSELAPLYYHEAMNSLWYGAVLSGFGTQDANITFNLNQVLNSALRALAVLVVNNIKNKGSFIEKTQSTGKDLYSMFFRTLYQDANTNSFQRNIFRSTFTNARYGFSEGLSSYAETEKALESQQQSEVDYTRYSKYFKIFNASKYVTRALAAMDLASQDLIKNAWIVPMLRDIYGKEGLSPKAIDAKISQELAHNLVEIEVARQQAIDDIIRYDIDVVEKNGKFNVTYNGKTVFTADTLQEANDLKEKAALKQEVAIRRFSYERLQNKINNQALRSATHLSQETIMSATPSGLASAQIYDWILQAKNRMTTFAKKQEQEARASNSTAQKLAKGQVARVTYFVARVIPFVKMLINLTENFFVKDNPLGYLRAMRIESAAKNPTSKLQEKLADFYQSETQINDLKARAIIGTLLWAVPLLWQATKPKDDDDEEKYLSEVNDLKVKDEYLKEIQDAVGGSMASDNPYLIIPKDGEVFGSLEFIEPRLRKAMENAGLAKPHSKYVGTFPNGKFVSLIANPRTFNFATVAIATANMIKKYVVDNKYDKLSDEDKRNALENVIMQAAYYSAGSFGSFSITKKGKSVADQVKQGKWKDALITSVENIIPETNVANPAILKQSLAYLDGISREYILPSNDFTTYAGTKIPILGSFISVYGANKRYGMFGEEMYSVPAMLQGALSQYYYDFRFGGKNKAEKEMYQLLASKGYNKIKSMPNTMSILSEDGTKERVITDEEKNKLGAEAGKAVFNRLSAEKEKLKNLEPAIVNTYVDKLFNLEYKKAWLTYNNAYGANQAENDKQELELIIEVGKEKIAKLEEILNEYNVTEREIDLLKIKGKRFEEKEQVLRNALKKENFKSNTLDMWVELGIITNAEREELE